jgi:hypothetical protein
MMMLQPEERWKLKKMARELSATMATELQRRGFTVVKNALNIPNKQLSEWSDDVFVSPESHPSAARRGLSVRVHFWNWNHWLPPRLYAALHCFGDDQGHAKGAPTQPRSTSQRIAFLE